VNKAVLAVYDLQAVILLPKGECSAFYYSSKLNNLNFTITALIKKKTPNVMFGMNPTATVDQMNLVRVS